MSHTTALHQTYNPGFRCEIYWSVCTCGWVGALTDDRLVAVRDGAAHRSS